MQRFWLLFLIVLVGGCSSAPGDDQGETPPSVTTVTGTVTVTVTAEPTSTIAPSARPPTKSETASSPVLLPELGEDMWLVQDWQEPDRIVQTDREGMIQQVMWEQDADVVGSFDVGHTVLCEDVDADGKLDLVDVRFSFDGTLKDTYAETRSVNGQTIAESSRPVDGSSVPMQIHQICGQHSSSPILRVTAIQWSAALRAAGFTDIAGDHAIDPTWEAGATWEGVEYWPLNLYQGDFRPSARDEIEVIECGLGAIEIPRSLPASARTALFEVSRCPHS